MTFYDLIIANDCCMMGSPITGRIIQVFYALCKPYQSSPSSYTGLDKSESTSYIFILIICRQGRGALIEKGVVEL
jgi:hypothetical protein